MPGGVFKSSDGGGGWAAANAGLTNTFILALAVDPTNVNVILTVTDTQTGAVKTYVNPQGAAFQPIQDTDAFAASASIEPADATFGVLSAVTPGESWLSQPFWAQASCAAGATTLCLNGGRFKVQTQWTTSDGQNGSGQAVALTSDTGYFWFFSPNNVEMVVKAVNGCSFNSSYWVFAGGLTNVRVVMTVTDTQSGAVRTYTNPQSTAFQPLQDTSAFSCP